MGKCVMDVIAMVFFCFLLLLFCVPSFSLSSNSIVFKENCDGKRRIRIRRQGQKKIREIISLQENYSFLRGVPETMKKNSQTFNEEIICK